MPFLWQWYLSYSNGLVASMRSTPFGGMPPTHPVLDLHSEGDFKECDFQGLTSFIKARALGDWVRPVVGKFDETLPKLLSEGFRAAFAHCDCDVYEGVRYVCRNAPFFLESGGYLVLDDPLHGSCLGAFTAVEEELITAQRLRAEQTFPHLVYRVSNML